MNVDIFLIEPENEGNVGAVARIMKNFGFKRLFIVGDIVLGDEAYRRCTHGADVLDNLQRVDFNYLKNYDLVVGTTSKLGSDYNLNRVSLTPKVFAKEAGKMGKVALLFGRESRGLSNDELKLCGMVLSIPTSDFSALNLSHAVGIVCYELFIAPKYFAKDYDLASGKERGVLYDYVRKVIDKVEWPTPEKKDTQKILWKRIINRMFLTKREAFGLIGFFRRVLR